MKVAAERDREVVLLDVRVRAEFNEMPGLRLTPAQAARLWAVDGPTSEQVLNRLTSSGFLFKNREGAYSRASQP